MTLNYKSVTNGELVNFKKVVITQVDLDSLTCIALHQGRTQIQVSLYSAIGMFYHFPDPGEEWIITKLGPDWVLQSRTAYQNPAVAVLKESDPGTTILASGDQVLSFRGDQITSNNTNIDTWKTITFTRNINSIANTAVRIQHRTTIDRICEMRVSVIFPSAPTSLFMGITLTGAPAPSSVPSDPTAVVMASISTGGSLIPGSYYTNTDLVVLGPGSNPSSITALYTSFVFTADKV